MNRTKSSNSCYITCAGKTDGAGAQIQAVLSTKLFAMENGLTYVHTPFVKIAHSPLEEYNAALWERFTGLGDEEVKCSDLDLHCIDIIDINQTNLVRNENNVLYRIEHCHDFADKNPDAYKKLCASAQKKYNSAARQLCKSHREQDKFNIAIHIRRGDVTKRTPERYTNNYYYDKVLKYITRLAECMGLDIHINLYSQGVIEDFSDICDFDIEYHLEQRPFETFYNLTSSDLLIMSKSSFSYSAALLSRSVKIYEPFWHNPLEDWIEANPTEDVRLDTSKLKRQLIAYLSA